MFDPQASTPRPTTATAQADYPVPEAGFRRKLPPDLFHDRLGSPDLGYPDEQIYNGTAYRSVRTTGTSKKSQGGTSGLQQARPQRSTSICNTPSEVALGEPRRRPVPAIPGAATQDHFDLYWEVAPHRSISITAGQSASSLSGIGEHFGRGDLFANLHPICSQLQGQANQRLLTVLTCAHSTARRHRALSTAAQNRRALRGKQDAASDLTCWNVEPQAGLGAVAWLARALAPATPGDREAAHDRRALSAA
ncbi:hypothetical protein AB0869_14895 [Micromonospora vinacea]|uniref:hypothetical protein n=1 Tax=Micromonospora vinacea TaxID=709878 RepID=UPI0034537E27